MVSNARLIAFTLLNLLNYLDRYLVQALLPLISLHYSLSYEESGLLASAFVFGYFITSPLFGVLGDRWHRPRLMAVGILLWSAATVGGGLADLYAAFFALRLLVGIGEASFGTILPGYIKDGVGDPLKVNRAFSILYAAIPVGSALAYVLGGLVAAHYPWQYAFFLGGLPGLLLALWVWKLPEYRMTRDAASTETASVGAQRSVLADLRELAAVPVLWYAIIGYALNSFALNAIATFVAHYGVALGFTHQDVTQYFGLILVVTGFIGTLCGGSVADKFAKRRASPIPSMLRFVGITALMAVPFCAAAFLVSSQFGFLALCAVAQLLIFAGVAPINSVLVLAAPSHLVTLVQGVAIFALNALGALCAPWFVGRLADTWSLASALQLSTVALFFCGIVWCAGARVANRNPA